MFRVLQRRAFVGVKWSGSWLEGLVDGAGGAYRVTSCGMACCQVRGQLRRDREVRGSVIERCSAVEQQVAQVILQERPLPGKFQECVEEVRLTPHERVQRRIAERGIIEVRKISSQDRIWKRAVEPCLRSRVTCRRLDACRRLSPRGTCRSLCVGRRLSPRVTCDRGDAGCGVSSRVTCRSLTLAGDGARG